MLFGIVKRPPAVASLPASPPLPEKEPNVRYLRLVRLVPSLLLLLATPAPAQTAGSYTAPAEFMDLFFDFTGSNEPGYPAGQPTLGQMLTQAEAARESARHAPGPLVLVFGSDIDVYESAGGTRMRPLPGALVYGSVWPVSDDGIGTAPVLAFSFSALISFSIAYNWR